MDGSNGRKKVYRNILISIVFLLVIGSFFAASFIVKDKGFSENENRELAGFPAISAGSISDGSFTKGFESYVQDQFPGRDKLMSLKTASEKAAGKGDNGLVYFGKDGYLFAMEDIELEQLQKNISYINRFAGENDMEMKLLIVPTASEILKDKLPKHLEMQDEKEAFDCIENTADIPFADVRGILSEHSHEYIYYRTDHHWTSLGAFYGYNELMGKSEDADEYDITKVSEDFYGTNYSKAMLSSIEPDSIFRYDLKNKEEYRMDIYEGGKKEETFLSLYNDEYLGSKDKYSYFLSGNNPLTVIERKDCQGEGKDLLIVKDSFAHCFIPFIVSDYDRVVAVDMRYYRSGLKDVIDEYEIDEVLFLYNIINFSNDTNIVFINR